MNLSKCESNHTFINKNKHKIEFICLLRGPLCCLQIAQTDLVTYNY